MTDIQTLKTQYEHQLLRIPGVTGVGKGVNKDGLSCLKVYTSVAPERVKALLPEALQIDAVELVFTGDIDAQ